MELAKVSEDVFLGGLDTKGVDGDTALVWHDDLMQVSHVFFGSMVVCWSPKIFSEFSLQQHTVCSFVLLGKPFCIRPLCSDMPLTCTCIPP